MSQPVGPFSTTALGSIDSRQVRLDFVIESATDMRAVRLVDAHDKENLPQQVAAPTFEEAIEQYAWDEAIEALALDVT